MPVVTKTKEASLVTEQQVLDAIGRDKCRKVSSGEWKARCPAHDDHRPSLTFGTGDDGTLLIRCHVGCRFEDILAALNLKPQPAEYRIKPSNPAPKPPPVKPVPDAARLQSFMEKAVTNIMSGNADKWLKHRGLTLDYIGLEGSIGFVTHDAGWQYPIVNTWAFLIRDAEGTARGVKLHRENAKTKSGWLPIGTEPADTPRHGYGEFWPCPEWEPPYFVDRNPLFILPGELKAAAYRCAGFNAISITTGENFRWTDPFIRRVAGRDVVVVYDDDPAGHAFRDNTVNALRYVCRVRKPITHGRVD